ncbi:sulfite exporter TauE/SafE family protein [Botrimarina sp.]|uniref:sulfite exporter TauE/SafE family protein n=1 Tax=Botrimarina sp. TaxID=2795802 RepID=UPI0032ED93F4
MLLAVLSASLLGSPHCAGMCGPFCGLAVSGGRSRGGAAGLQAAYHGGRLITYVAVGAAAGAAGALLDLASTLAGLQPIALALAGGAMVLFGLAELAKARRWGGPLARFGHWRPPAAWIRTIQHGQRFAARRDPAPRALMIGLLTTLLPCGWLYAFFVTAAGSGGPLQGAAVMGVFWVGTLPVLLTLGMGVRRLAGVLGDRAPLVTASALIAVGIFTLAGRQSLSATVLASRVTADRSQATAPAPDPAELPACCRKAAEARR